LKKSVDLLGTVTGRLEAHRDGYGWVTPADPEQPTVYLSADEMRQALHGDQVSVRIVRQDRKGRPEGRLLEILDRPKGPIIGRILLEAGNWVLAPEDRRYGQDILIARSGLGSATAGQVVSVELTEPPAMYVQPVGRVVEVLGEIDDPGLEIEIAVRKFSVPHVFSESVLGETAALPSKVRAVDTRGRVDLTDLALVTIDGEDARDFDDAVYCERLPNGEGWRLVVAIADVSHYVKPGMALDQQAYERSTSVYFPRRVIPMLPEKLSNGLCSLNPNETRLAFVCDMVVDPHGDVQAYQFFPAAICSHARLTYTEVAAVLANTRGPEAQKRLDLLDRLLCLHEVYRALLSQRERRGAVDFDTTETQIVCDESGRIQKIVARQRNEAHRLIEEAMLAANVCAADFIATEGHPALYRIHEGPSPEKRVTLQNYLRALGLGLSVSENPHPGEFQGIARATRDRPDAAQIHQMLLRSMQQAVYSPDTGGHFGLAYPAYTHFTSPIRRYPDLLVHRVIKGLLNGKVYRLSLPTVEMAPAVHLERLSARARSKAHAGAEASKPQRGRSASAALQDWQAAGLHTSACERRADEASRDVEAWLKCRFMRDRLGETYQGTVSAVVPFGVFVTLDELFVEGLVHVTELGGDHYRFDEARQTLRGDRSGMSYGVGSRLHVQLIRVDLDSRRMDFRLVKEGLSAAAVPTGARRGKGGTATELLAAVVQEDRQVKRSRAAKASAPSKARKSARSASGAKGKGSKKKTST
jgi:ribonuclease R